MNSAAELSSPPRDAQSFRRRLIGFIAVGEVGVLAAMALLIAFFWLLEPAFLSERNIRAILNVVSFVGIIAIGQTVLLVAGEFDLSVGSVAGLSAVVAAKLMTAAALPVTVGILCGIGVGALIGLLNGLIVVRLGIPAFIQTLGMLFIGQGLIQVVTGGYPVYPLPEAINTIGGTDLAFGLGWSFAFFIIAAVAADFVLRRTVLGRNIYATGGNKEVAHLVGINTNACKIGAFITVGALSAIAGMFVMADLGSGGTSIGSGWELTVIAGVVVGGVSLFGGAGTVAGGVVGILMLKVVQSGLVVIGVNSNWQQIAVGVIMVMAVGLDIVRRRYFIAGA
ncbi:MULTISPECIES: ABC transporter permease [unclassified Mesorhizobium]|uniref:ABC transporter permease n=1 Tax=unclassified Mesorhizobium TaxID=325217 RepID=UPI000F7595A4|nr:MULTISPECIES: ABC transporter permease [unclassified Mesorhizobium]AZO57073.1 ABC transporter permease [Mesorhizobium sp. M8A.F.Ca.ET.057.01.1.1]RWE48083.1 MAG: ABC transporter permease [Mesorhizobium sp.]